MIKRLILILALTIPASISFAESFTCTISSYGSPTNFSGSRSQQKEAMIPWLPSTKFRLVTESYNATLFQYDERIPSSRIIFNQQSVTYVFQKTYKTSQGRSFQAKTDLSISNDLSFNVRFTINGGSGYKNASGSAYGRCTIN